MQDLKGSSLIERILTRDGESQIQRQADINELCTKSKLAGAWSMSISHNYQDISGLRGLNMGC